MNYLARLLGLGLLILSCSFASASDREKEKRWAEQVIDTIIDGEPVYLNDGEADFLAIDTRAEEPAETAVIVLHGIGVHPNWEQVILPLRVRLAEAGYNTLSLQLPVLPNEATDKEYAPLMKEVPARIDAGIRYLHKEGAKKVVLVAHSMGASMAAYYLAHKTSYQEAQTETPITGFVGIGMGPGNLDYLPSVKLPVLDLYGSEDLPDVVKLADKRVAASKQNEAFSQIKVEGANHFFDSKNDVLLDQVKQFIAPLR